MNLATALVKGKIRLWIEYAMIGLVIVMAACAFWFYIGQKRQEAATAILARDVVSTKAELSVVKDANESQGRAIATLRNTADINDELLAGLRQDFDKERVSNKNLRGQLAFLERSNEAVKAYLANPVPSPVGCVLDKTCSSNRDGVVETKPGATDPLPPTGTRAEPHKR